MKYERYDQETAYQTGEIAQSAQHLCIRIDYIAGQVEKLDARLARLVELNEYMAEKLCDFVDMEREMLEMQKETREMQREMHEMQKEMFLDYKKVREQAHVKLQGDMEGNHATAHTS